MNRDNRAPFRVKCIESENDLFAVGKIYELDKDGWIIGKKGILLTDEDLPITSFEDWYKDYKKYSWDNCEFEEAPVLPNICYVLGEKYNPLEINEEFEIEGYDDWVFRINSEGDREFRKYRFDKGWSACNSEYTLNDVINHPGKVIRESAKLIKPKLEFTEDEKKYMQLFINAGYPWVAAEDGGDMIFAYQFAPDKNSENGEYQCYSNQNDAKINMCKSFETDLFSFSQITYENSPIDMRNYV